MTEGGGGGPGAAQVVFQDPKNTAQLLDLHKANTPFIEMAKIMGVDLDPAYAELITSMSDAEVQIIRAAMVQALENANPIMPYHCHLQDQTPSAIVVTSVGPATNLLARIEPA